MPFMAKYCGYLLCDLISIVLNNLSIIAASKTEKKSRRFTAACDFLPTKTFGFRSHSLEQIFRSSTQSAFLN